MATLAEYYFGQQLTRSLMLVPKRQTFFFSQQRSSECSCPPSLEVVDVVVRVYVPTYFRIVFLKPHVSAAESVQVHSAAHE